ncbi:ASKHA domain-containing protein [Ilumatobacter nonamiensis]|uniref:ASKHA domain-containing protein n=1 Tax=Ilumatobacter nonamiensis TaxID=467093 RepID=UPI000349E7FF|nr:ASKHA domain-containing protein [Ilumatobacter nonamiensis]
MATERGGRGMTADGDTVEVHRVVFAPSGLTARVAEGTTVLDAARSVGADLDSTCGGRGICGRCQVIPSSGSFSKWQIESDADALTEWTSVEEEYTGRRPIADGQRLGCAALVRGDVVVEIPAASQVHRQVVRKSVDVGSLELDPMVRLHYVELPIAELGAEVGGLREQIVASLTRDFDVTPTDIDARLLPLLAPTAKRGDNSVTVAVRDESTICAVYPGYVDRAVGIAVDVGSTTIAAHLVDLANGEVLATNGIMNPQIRFGDDLMSRVSYVMMNPGGDVELTRAIRRALDTMVGDLVGEAGLERDAVLDMTIVGNPIMHHVVLGIDPTPLGQAPFTLATDGAVTTRATDLDVDARFCEVYLLPCIAGHVGADMAGAILSEGPHRHDELQLLVDVGTNAEIVFGNSSHVLAASSPTGPAFEGAQISAGMRATAGAIERVRIDRDTFEPRVRVIGAEAWSDDSDFVGQAAGLDISGVCGSGIIEVIGELYLAGLIDVDGTIRSDGPEKTARIFPDGRTFSYRLFGDSDDPAENINITQDDVRAIQLAKAALRAGIDLLCEHNGTTDPNAIGSVRLAGAFGAHIDPLYAKVLGLVPDVPVAQVASVGNAAGAGAVRALLSAQQRREIEQTARQVEKIETATEPRFQELFVNAMGFPHTSEPTPNLAAETVLPVAQHRSEAAGARRRTGRRRPRT